MEEVDKNGGPTLAMSNSKRNSLISEGRGSNQSRPNSYHSRHSSPRGSLPEYKDLSEPPPSSQPSPSPDEPLMPPKAGSQRSSLRGSKNKIDTRLEIDPDGGCNTVPEGEHLKLPPEEDQSRCLKSIAAIQKHVHGFFKDHGPVLKKIAIVVLVLAYTTYLIYAIYTSPSGALVLIVLTALVVTYFIFKAFWGRFGRDVHAATCGPIGRITKRRWWKYCRWAIYGLIAIGAIIFLILDVGSDLKRLTSAGGMLTFILLVFITSTNPSRVNWRPVIWGIGLQFILGVLILRWSAGFHFFKFMGDQVKVFLDYTNEGSRFVFGDKYMDHPMAFKVFPIVIYFSAVISIFYYWGLMQFIVCKIAWLMGFTMGTTAIESLNAATNIFIGMAESCVILRPFLPKLTKSELHAVMTGGFATVAGSYIALLVEVGASPEHLLSAAIMSAPAALAMGKLSYPETEVSHTKTQADVYMDKTPARNVIEAASNGAIAAIKVVASVAANLIAIIGLITFFNATLSYLGARVGFPQLTFQLACSYIFWPVAAVMGVELADAGKVASLLGTKVFVDEFISFHDLGIMVKNGEIAERSTVIATYACCGFGSIAAVGVYIGALVSVSPEKRGDISEVALRAVVNGNIAGFLTACIAGVLYTGGDTLFSPGGAVDVAINATLLANATQTPP